MTNSEIKILQSIAKGASSREIATELGIKERTVEKHRSHIIQKIGLSGGGPNSLTRWALVHRDDILK